MRYTLTTIRFISESVSKFTGSFI